MQIMYYVFQPIPPILTIFKRFTREARSQSGKGRGDFGSFGETTKITNEGRSKKKVVSVHFGGFSKVVRHVTVSGTSRNDFLQQEGYIIPRRRRKLGVKTQFWIELRSIFVQKSSSKSMIFAPKIIDFELHLYTKIDLSSIQN